MKEGRWRDRVAVRMYLDTISDCRLAPRGRRVEASEQELAVD